MRKGTRDFTLLLFSATLVASIALRGCISQEARQARAETTGTIETVVGVSTFAYEGVVRGPDGQVLEGASIYIVKVPYFVKHDTQILLLDETDAKGQFKFEIAMDANYDASWFVVDKAPFAVTYLRWNVHSPPKSIGTDTNDLVVTLGTAAVVEGSLETLKGDPVENAAITPIFFKPRIPGVMENIPFPPMDALLGVRTDAGGKFKLSRMPAETRYGLRIHHAERGWSFFGVENAGYPQKGILTTKESTVKAFFTAGGAVEGVVLNRKTGEPLANVKIIASLVPARQTGEYLPKIETTSDENGAYRLDGLPTSLYYVFTIAEDKYGVPVPFRVKPLETVRANPLYLGDGVRFSGRIMDTNLTEVVAGTNVSFRLFAENLNWQHEKPVLHDDGTFEGRAAAGWVLLIAQSNTMDVHPEDRETRLILSPDYENKLTIRVKPYDTINIRVLLPNGTPAEGAIVVLQDYSKAPFTTDASGWARHPLSAFHFGHKNSLKTYVAHSTTDETLRGAISVPLTSPELATGVITLQQAATVAGTIMDEHNKSIAGFKINIRGQVPGTNGFIFAITTSDEKGHFVVPDLIPGLEYSFWAPDLQLRRTFEPGEEVEWDIIAESTKRPPVVEIPEKIRATLTPEQMRRLGIKVEER